MSNPAALDPVLVQEMVGVSHGNLGRVESLLEQEPTLVNACWDWGAGDFETPLGAASHMGRRDIAEFLLANGARLDIFAAAMLGMTAVVESAIDTNPDVLRALGPHGIPLIKHAEVGGEKAKEVYDILEERLMATYEA